MKILFLNDGYPPQSTDSVSSITKTWKSALEERGHDITVITTHRKEQNSSIVREKGVVSLPVTYRISLRHYMSLWNPRVSQMLAEELDNQKPDIVHAHNIHMYLTYSALQKAKQRARGVCLTLHDVMSFAYGKLETERFLNSGDCRMTPLDHWRTAGLQYNPLRNIYIRKIVNTCTVFAVGNALKDAAEQNGIRNVTTLYNAIDVNEWNENRTAIETFRQKHGMIDKKIVLFGGRISEAKGALAIAHAFRIVKEKIPHARLLVVGHKHQWEKMRTGLMPQTDYICTGWISSEEHRAAFFAADVITTPSLCLDPFNLMNVEAMAASKPVVGTMFGGTPEVVQHNVTGLICDPRDTTTYAQYLIDLLTHQEKATAFGKRGRERAVQHFSLVHQMDKLESHYQEIVQSFSASY